MLNSEISDQARIVYDEVRQQKLCAKMTDRNPSPPRLSAEETELIEGDKIGETVFSKKWALTTLMKLVQSLQTKKTNREDDENEEVEGEDHIDTEDSFDGELCELWDMSMNSVCVSFNIDASSLVVWNKYCFFH